MEGDAAVSLRRRQGSDVVPQGPNAEDEVDLEQQEEKESEDEHARHDESVHSSDYSGEWDDGRYYNWRTFWNNPDGVSIGGRLLMLTRGYDERVAEQTDQDLQESMASLARLLILLREYHGRYGVPDNGGPKDQEYVLREVVKDLYSGGAPIWALQPCMTAVAEGLTGKRGVDFWLLPRKAFVFAPSSGATSMFAIQRGFNISRLEAMEGLAVRLASYASNTMGVASVPTRLPSPQELVTAYRSVYKDSLTDVAKLPTAAAMGKKILKLASQSEGLFFFINSEMRPSTVVKAEDITESAEFFTKQDKDDLEKGSTGSPTSHDMSGDSSVEDTDPMSPTRFWKIEECHLELFSRLATLDAIRRIDRMDANRKVLYSHLVTVFLQFITSAGASIIWFKGGWVDMAIAGVCGVIVGFTNTALVPITAREERIIFEAVASYLVGMVAGLVTLALPEHACFGAIAISGIIDILQGFRVVYAVIEVLSKHTVAGGADFLEAILFTGLIAYFLRLGLSTAASIWMGSATENELETIMRPCAAHAVDPLWYLLFVPAAAFGWSGLFNPNYRDLPLMTFHGVLAYVVSWALEQTSLNETVGLFIAALSVTLSSGLLSRFTGRHALGNVVSGLYVLLPGAYLVNSVFGTSGGGSLDFIGQVITFSAVIGVGAWTGTILISPTIMGVNKGLLRFMAKSHRRQEESNLNPADEAAMMPGAAVLSPDNFPRRDKAIRNTGTGAILFF